MAVELDPGIAIADTSISSNGQHKVMISKKLELTICAKTARATLMRRLQTFIFQKGEDCLRLLLFEVFGGVEIGSRTKESGGREDYLSTFYDRFKESALITETNLSQLCSWYQRKNIEMKNAG